MAARSKKLRAEFLFSLSMVFLTLVFDYLAIAVPLMQFARAESWPQTDYVVDSVQTQDAMHQGQFGNHVTTYYDVTISYTFDGRRFSRLFGGQLKSSKVGQRGRCYVNPTNPKEMLLQRRFTRYEWLFASMMLIMTAIAVGVTVEKAIRIWKHSRNGDNSHLLYVDHNRKP